MTEGPRLQRLQTMELDSWPTYVVRMWDVAICQAHLEDSVVSPDLSSRWRRPKTDMQLRNLFLNSLLNRSYKEKNLLVFFF